MAVLVALLMFACGFVCGLWALQDGLEDGRFIVTWEHGERRVKRVRR